MKKIVEQLKKRFTLKSAVFAVLLSLTLVTSLSLARVYATYQEDVESVEAEIAAGTPGQLEDASPSEASVSEATESEAEFEEEEDEDIFSDEMDIEYVNENTIILPEPEREGYIFVCWCTTPEITEDSITYMAGDEYTIEGEETLYAIWIEDPDYNADEATASEASASEASTSEASSSEANASSSDAEHSSEVDTSASPSIADESVVNSTAEEPVSAAEPVANTEQPNVPEVIVDQGVNESLQNDNSESQGQINTQTNETEKHDGDSGQEISKPVETETKTVEATE